MTKFNAREFKKHGFVHIEEADFSDDGTRFQIWMHEESGLTVSYARHTYTDANGEKETMYFISPREDYYSHGLLYSDVCDEPEYSEADKYNGCYEVDLEELVGLMKKQHEMFLRVKAKVANEKVDTAKVEARAELELDALCELMDEVRHEVPWWNLNERELREAAENMSRIEKQCERLHKVLDGNIATRTKRELVQREERHRYVIDALEDGSIYSAFNILRKLVNEYV
jgi:hypothetical protein